MARPRGRLSAPEAVPQPHAWQRLSWLWEVYFAAVGVVTLVQLSHLGAPPPAYAVVGALAGWYAAFGRRHIRFADSGRWPLRLVYQLGALALFTAAVWLDGAGSLLSFALVPQTLMIWPLLPALGFVLALLALVLGATQARAGLLPGVAEMLSEFGILLFLAAVLAVYISGISRQSAERADLIERLSASRAEVSRLSHEAGVAAERQRLAGDIHDTIAQGLSSVVMLVQSAEAALSRDPEAARRHLSLAQRTARENLAEARALVAALTPAQLAATSLPEALERLGARAGTATKVTVAGPARPLPTATEVVLLRAAQESLTNVDRHAGARCATIVLSYDGPEVTLRVTDDGCGFRPDGPGDGYGLPGMRARVEQVGGELVVDSAPGGGTTVRVTVPA